MLPDLPGIEHAFFEAMANGYAQSVEKGTIAELPGSKAIPFLKECLHRAYVQERRFYGGRGPHFVRGDRFTYVNQIRRESFADFEGEEQVFDLSEHPLGHHWYRGMSLLKCD